MTILGALVLDRLRLAWRGPSVVTGAAAAAIASILAVSLPGLDAGERARSAIAALSGLATVLGGIVVAAAGASRVAHERETRRLAVDRASGAPRSAFVLSEVAHVAAVAAAVACVAALGAALAGGRDPLARPRPVVRCESTAAGSTFVVRSPWVGSGDVRLAFVPVVRKVPPDIPPRIAEISLRFEASGRTVSLRVENESLATVAVEKGDASPSGDIVATATPPSLGYTLHLEAAKLEGPPGSVAWNAFAFGFGLVSRLMVLGGLSILVGSVARPALAAGFVAALIAYGLFGGAAAQFARDLASHHDRAGGLPWDAIAALASGLDAIVPDLTRLSTASEWARGEIISVASVGRAGLHAALLCGGLCAICIALSRRQEVLSAA